MITKQENARINIERALKRRKEYIAEYNRLEAICNNRESQYKSRSARNIARLMLDLMDELEGVESLIKVYKKDLEEQK
jgi:regulator of sigma D